MAVDIEMTQLQAHDSRDIHAWDRCTCVCVDTCMFVKYACEDTYTCVHR